MSDKQENVIRYKWDPETETGFRLRFDRQWAGLGGHRCYQVEDWSHHVVTNSWGCDSLDEAFDVLKRFFEIDEAHERHLAEEQFPSRVN